MPTPPPDIPPAPLAAWSRAQHAGGMPAQHPRLRAAVAGFAALAGVLLLAALALPPLLDWGRFRGTIASIAAARLGRPVSIGGEVTLRLLPHAVLTAADVTLPDQGDGISATIASLRLEVGVVPLLTGRLAPRDLVLSSPVLHLPWPLPETLAAPGRPRVPRAFAAHLDNGTLLIGQTRVGGVTAALHTGPEASTEIGATPADGGAQGLGAEGFATFAGRSWRFTTALGVPDADGVSAVDLSISGQGPAARTDGTVRGTLADGVLQGRLVAGGPDLSLLLPSAALAWHAEAPFVADGARITAPSIGLSLGEAPADGTLTLRLTRPVRLDGKLHAAAIDLDGWARVLAARQTADRQPLPGLPGQVALSADRARLLGGTLTALRAVIQSDGVRAAVQDGAAMLPGHASLTLSGMLAASPEGPVLRGPASLDAPDLHATLTWLRPLAPALADALPAGILHRVTLAGSATLGRNSASLAGLSGEVDGQTVSGGIGAQLGPLPHLGFGLAFQHLPLDGAWSGPLPSLAALGHAATRLGLDAHLQAGEAMAGGRTLTGLRLDARSGTAGLLLQRASFAFGGLQVAASGAIGPDGTVSDGSLHVAAPGPGGVSPLLPQAWRWAAPAWQEPGGIDLAAAGPANDLTMQLRAQSGDLVLEADGQADPGRGQATGLLTVRHPGAPRLLAAFGLAAAERWLGTGSLALRSRVTATPDRLSVEDFDLRAAQMGVSGHLVLDRGGAYPHWDGALHADRLALPAPAQAEALRADWLRVWGADIAMACDQISLDGAPFADHVAARIALQGGAGLIEVAKAGAFGGQASGQLAFDATSAGTALASRVSLSGAQAAALSPGLPVGVASGQADIAADIATETTGDWRRSLSGDVSTTLHRVDLTGFDLTQAGAARTRHGAAARQALQAALSNGDTPDLAGTLQFAVAQGHLQLAPATLASGAGVVTVSGSADLPVGNLDLLFALAPADAPLAPIGVRVNGSLAAAHAQPVGVGPRPTVHTGHRR